MDLNNFLKKTPEEISLILCRPEFDLNELLESNRKDEAVVLINLIFAIEKALECNSMSFTLNELFLPKFIESEFLQEHVYEYMSKKFTDFELYLQFIDSIVKITYSSLILNPSYKTSLSPIVERLDFLINYRLNNSSLLNEYKRGLAKMYKIKSKYEPEIEEDFTQMSVVPRIRDILLNKAPMLKKNKISEPYESVREYLDTQFKLLREDFLQPLRLGVARFREIIKEANLRQNQILNEQVKYKLSRIESLNVYFDVEMDSNVCTDQGVVYSMKLSQSNRSYINWETSKKLIFGSLVCFSSDYFASECLIGIVCNRDSFEIMHRGIFHVKFNYDPSDLLNHHANFPCSNRNYIMLETTAFFESYKHVLHALHSFQQSPENEFPFKENLIDCKNKQIDRPEYLKYVSIDFRPLVDGSKIQVSDPATGYSKYIFSKESDYAQSCYLSKTSSWPTADQMGLDESQYDAVKLALENKLALIQGPPGTGKTYIGVKLVELLVHNRHLWWNKPNDRKRPILMVCYTNHALDQFLEYCVNVCKLDKGVVRVGSRCKNEKLNSFLLSNLKRSKKYSQDIQAMIKNELNNQRVLQDSLKKLTNLYTNLKQQNGIVSFNTIKKYIHENYLNQLIGYNTKFANTDNRNNNDYTLLEWLGMFDIDTEMNSVYDLTSNLEKLDLNKTHLNKSDKVELNDIENQYLNNERMLEDDFIFKIDTCDEYNKEYKKKTENFISFHEISDMAYYFNEINDLDSNFEHNINYLIKSRSKMKSALAEEIKSLKDYYKNLTNKAKYNNHIFNLDENIWRMGKKQKFFLYLNWIEELEDELKSKIQDLSIKFNQSCQILKEIRMQQDRSIMENALIIAMTTTGSSRYHNILKDIGPRIVIVEEAAEVFEAHIVSSLSKHCEHLILIGDHAQLRPNPAVYSLAIDYKLDVSLFERLINNNAKKVMLKCQHRMRPEISVLMKHFYDQNIENHSSVYKFENINGINKNIFFINHDKLETKLYDSLSKFNKFEVTYLVKLCSYLIKQNYSPSQITVLTMYLGQSSELRNMLRHFNLTEIKVSTVDNFQGEENDIILLSLVRSNQYGKIGFLNIHNRVCVALSRARKGFYCIGNLDFISKYSDKWLNIVESLKQTDSIGSSLKLTCSVHSENDIEASEPAHFDQRPDGGCKLMCNFELKCGHLCSKFCHGKVDPNHCLYKCNKLCNKTIKRCGHKCIQVCSHEENCEKCGIKIEKFIAECGHTVKLGCAIEPLKIFCPVICESVLPCGHKCLKPCCRHFNTDDHTSVCNSNIEVETDCKHKTKILMPCSEPRWMIENKCTKQCGELLDCGHTCKNSCGKCLNGKIHSDCSEIIEHQYPCGHIAKIQCSKRFLPCDKNCFFKCSHRLQDLECTEPWFKCNKPCQNNCYHHKCNKKCHEICDRDPCKHPCTKLLKCGHQCIGVCGEPCPRLCRICNKNRIYKLTRISGNLENLKFVYLFDCKHLIELNKMDDWVKSNFDNSKNEFSKLPKCPICKKSIKYNMRYSNIIKHKLNELDQLKIVEYGNLDENKKEQDDFLEEIEKFFKANNSIDQSGFDREFLNSLIEELGDLKLSKNELVAYKHSWNAYLELFNLKAKKLFQLNKTFDTDQFKRFEHENKKMENYLFSAIESQVIRIYSEQKFYDILSEIRRINYIIKYYNIKDKTFSNITSEVIALIEFLKNILIDSSKKLNDKDESLIKSAFECIDLALQNEPLPNIKLEKFSFDTQTFKHEKSADNFI